MATLNRLNPGGFFGTSPIARMSVYAYTTGERARRNLDHCSSILSTAAASTARRRTCTRFFFFLNIILYRMYQLLRAALWYIACLVGRRVGVAQRPTNHCTVPTPLAVAVIVVEQLTASGPICFNFTHR